MTRPEYTHPITVTEEQVVAWLTKLPQQATNQGIAKNLTDWMNGLFSPETVKVKDIKQEILETWENSDEYVYIEADQILDKESHPDNCDEMCPDYMETGKFCGEVNHNG